MTTVEQEAPATNTGALSQKTSLDVCPKDTTSAAVVAYNAMIDDLDSGDLLALASLYRDRAERQRDKMPDDEARDLVEKTWISEAAEASEFAPIIQVRVCLRRLVESGIHPERLRDVFLEIARDRAPCERIARAAISEGVRDGLERRAARQ